MASPAQRLAQRLHDRFPESEYPNLFVDSARLRLEQPIGDGSAGVVHRAFLNPGNRPCAVKCYFPKRELAELAGSEASDPVGDEISKLLELRNSRYVVQLLGVALSETALMIIMELADQGDLRRHMAELQQSPVLCYRILLQVAEALDYLRTKRVGHLDLKPSNLLVFGEWTIKVCDFNVARVAFDDRSTLLGAVPLVGTYLYMAPEQYGTDAKITFAADIYAFGLLALELLCGVHPFAGETFETLRSLMLDGRVSHTVPAMIPLPLRELLQRCLELDPSQRPLPREVVTTFRDLPALVRRSAAELVGWWHSRHGD